MRARRLRRLGVVPIVQSSPLNESQTLIDATQSKNDLSLDAQKNKISLTHESVESDENEHKQKQIKFDEDIDVRQKKESILNNNDDPIRKKLMKSTFSFIYFFSSNFSIQTIESGWLFSLVIGTH